MDEDPQCIKLEVGSCCAHVYLRVRQECIMTQQELAGLQNYALPIAAAQAVVNPVCERKRIRASYD